MKILMLAPLPPPSGGIASWTVRFKRYCDDNGISLRIVNIAIQGERASSETMKRNLKDEAKRTYEIIKNLRKDVRAGKPDVVHINTSCQPMGVIRDAICALFIKNDIPMILHCRCNIADQIGSRRISHAALRYLIKRSRKTIVLNKFSKQYVDHIEMNKAVFIPNHIDSQMIDEFHFINENIREVVYVGHIERAKGIKQIANAAQKLPKIHFNLIGAVREDISDIEIPQNVTITGRVSMEEVQSYLRNTDVFLFPSLSEGFSNALLEAMAMGLPIIASDVGANSEMIEAYGGVLLTDNTGEDIVNAIECMGKSEVRRHMSEWNVKKVKQNYVTDVVMRQYFGLYKDVILI